MNEIYLIGILIGMFIVGFIFDYNNIIKKIKNFKKIK